jgi:hypothetical protein
MPTMAEDKSIEKLLEEQPTVNELNETLDNPTARSIYKEGKIEPEIKHGEQEVLVDREGLEAAKKLQGSKYENKLKWNEREGVSKLAIPLDLVLTDIPYAVGYKSSKKNLGEKEANWDSRAGAASTGVSALSITYDVGMELANNLSQAAGLDEEYFPLAVAGIIVGRALKGRSDGIKANDKGRYLEEIEDIAGDYEINTF